MTKENVSPQTFTHTQARELAAEFIAQLHQWLTDKQLDECRQKIQTEAYSEACPTHDYCDANIAMDLAFRRIIGREMQIGFENEKEEAQAEADMQMINTAWDFARKNKYRTPKP